MTTRLCALALTALISTAALAQRNFDNVTIKTTHVAGNVHMLEGSGGNIGVSVGPDGILIIDDQFAPLADKIRKALAKLGEVVESIGEVFQAMQQLRQQQGESDDE